MAYAMTKQGSLDNVVTYEFMCDTLTDMNAIENRYRTIGSVAIVLSGESEGLEVYISGSDKQWHAMGAGIGGSGGNEAVGGLTIYMCTQNEYDAETKIPTVSEPDETALYLVPASEDSGNLYDEYIYVNNAWEKFGSGNVSNNLPITYDYQEETIIEFKNITLSEDNDVIIDDITKIREGSATLQINGEEYPLDLYYHSYEDEDPYYSGGVNYGDDGWLEIIIPANSGTKNVQCSFRLSMYYGEYESQEDVYIKFPLISDVIISSENIYISTQDNEKKEIVTKDYVDNNFVTYDHAKYSYAKIKDSVVKIGKYYDFDFEPIYFKGMTSFSGRNIWKDGNNIYLHTSKKLDRENSTWREIDMTSQFDSTSNFTSNIWTDGTNIYYSNNSVQYAFNGSKMTWEKKQWNLSNFLGADVWTDGTNIYLSSGLKQYILNKLTSTWETKTWIFSSSANQSYLYGRYIWTDGEHIYNTYSINYRYILNENTWSSTSAGSGSYTAINKKYIWTDGDNIYYSERDNQLILDKSGTDPVWKTKTWDNLTNFSGDDVWTDGNNIYYSYGTTQYIFNKSNSTWSEKEWAGASVWVDGSAMWTDGTNIYCNYDDSRSYVLNKSTLTWSPITWGITNFTGIRVWSDGDNIYYSNYSDQYIFNKSTSTWDEKVWNGLNEFDGSRIWTDGENIYYCDYYNNENYILNKATSTWSTKVWNNIEFFQFDNVWTDGTNIYYSNGPDQQFKLSKNKDYWSNMYWNTSIDIYGISVWNDGENTYCIYNQSQYKLDLKTLRWNEIDYLQLPSNFNITNIWKDGNDIYYTSQGRSYKLVRKNKILLGMNGEFYPQDAEKLVLPSVSSTDNGKVLKVTSGEWSVENEPDISGLAPIPAAPISDGTYYLSVTVSSGVPTYSWVTIPTT